MRPVEDLTPAAARLPTGPPVAIALLHGQLASLAWAFQQAAPGARLGYVQAAGGALLGGLARRCGCCANAFFSGAQAAGNVLAATMRAA